MGESRRTRAALIAQLANMDPYPESVPINNLVQVEGTPLHGAEALDPFEFVRTIACARITMPKAMVRLSAGRQEMSEGDTGAVLSRGREFDLLRREAAHHRQPRSRAGRGALRAARAQRDADARRCLTCPPHARRGARGTRGSGAAPPAPCAAKRRRARASRSTGASTSRSAATITSVSPRIRSSSPRRARASSASGSARARRISYSATARAHHELEECARAFLGLPAALFFSSGYMANLGPRHRARRARRRSFRGQAEPRVAQRRGATARAEFKRYPHVDLPRSSGSLAKRRAPGKVIVERRGVQHGRRRGAGARGCIELAERTTRGSCSTTRTASACSARAAAACSSTSACARRASHTWRRWARPPACTARSSRASPSWSRRSSSAREPISTRLRCRRSSRARLLTSLELIESDEWRRSRMFAQLIARLKARVAASAGACCLRTPRSSRS